MATVFDYLEKIRQENPAYRGINDYYLYQKLKEQDQNLPSWESVDTSATQAKLKQTKHERKQSPDFLNSFFDWTDWGIDENSRNWAKSAYNHSITGLAYQLHNGEERFDLDGYNPGIVEDIFSMVLSFSMPLDFATMGVGRMAGTAIRGLAGQGLHQRMTSKLVAHAGANKTGRISQMLSKNTINKKATREAKAKAFADKLIGNGGFGDLLATANPRLAGAIGQASTLAVFEGVRGGMQAAVDGTDIWEGVGHGIMHGGIMGGVAGWAGASLNVTHAKLFNKKSTTPLSTMEDIAYKSTGKIGQVVGEGTIFTAPDILNVIQDDAYTLRDLGRNMAVNIGMMGVLKAQHSLMAKGKGELYQWALTDGKAKATTAKQSKEAAENMQKTVDMMPEETSSQKKMKKEAQKDVDDFVKRQVKNRDVEIKDFEEAQSNYDLFLEIVSEASEGGTPVQASRRYLAKIRRDIREGKETRSIKEILEKFGVEKESDLNDGVVANFMHTQLLTVLGAMNKNIKAGDRGYTDARKGKIEETQKLVENFNRNILDKLNDIDAFSKSSKVFTKTEIKEGKEEASFSFSRVWEHAERHGNKRALKDLRRGLEKEISEKGEIKDLEAWEKIQEKANVYEKTYMKKEKGEGLVKGDTKEHLKDDYQSREEGTRGNVLYKELSPKKYSKEINELEQKGDLTSKEAVSHRKLNKKDKDSQAEYYGETADSRKAYNESKLVLAELARKSFRDKPVKGMETQFQHIVDFAKYLADLSKPKSFFEATNKDFQNFINQSSVAKAQLVRLVNVLKGMRDVYSKKLFKNFAEFDLLTNPKPTEVIGSMLGKKKTMGAGEGLQVPGGRESSLTFKENQLEFVGKDKPLVKYISDTLTKGFKSLISNAKTLVSKLGHKDFLFRSQKGEAFVTHDVSYFTAILYGIRKLKGNDLTYGEGRLFRNSFAEWGVEKYKSGSTESNFIDNVILGHAREVKGTYEWKGTKAKKKELALRLIKEYINDIQSGKFKTKSGSDAYSVSEIKAGFDIISGKTKFKSKTIDSSKLNTFGHGKVSLRKLTNGNFEISYFEGQGRGKPKKRVKKTISKEDLQTMFQYMIETAPRLNEIAPTKESVLANEKFAKRVEVKEKAPTKARDVKDTQGKIEKALNKWETSKDNKSKKEAEQTLKDAGFKYDKKLKDWVEDPKMKIEHQLQEELRTGEKIIETQELYQQIKWVNKKFPRLLIALEKTLGKQNGKYVLGKIHNHLIKIAENKAKVDTLPHEVAHHVVDVLKEIGDPFSKKIIKDGIKRFKKKNMTKEQAEEALVDAIGKYVAKELPKSMIGRMRSWVSRAVNHLRQYFGITNPQDAARVRSEIITIIGGKVLSGKIPTDYISLKSKMRVKYQHGNSIIRKVNDRIHAENGIEKLLMKDLKFTKDMIDNVRMSVFGSKKYAIDKKNATKNKPLVTAGELLTYENRLQTLYKSRGQGKSKKESNNISEVKEIEEQYQITEQKRDAYFEDVHGIKFKDATPSMIKSYRHYISLGKEVTPHTNTTNGDLNILHNKKTDGSVALWKRAFMRATDVIERFGEEGKRIARALIMHDYTRSVTYKGPGEEIVERIKLIVTDKNVTKNYMKYLDKDVANAAIRQVRSFKNKAEKNAEKAKKDGDIGLQKTYKKEQKRWESELLEMTQVKESFHGKDGKYKSAKELKEELFLFYWNSLGVEINRNTRSAREFENIMETINEKFVQDYFVRRVTKEALQHINEETPALKRIVKSNIKKLDEAQLKKIAKSGDNKFSAGRNKKYKDLFKKSPEFQKKVKDKVMEELMQMIEWGPAKIKPQFMRERGVTLGEYMEIRDKNGHKKLIKVYEGGIEATMQSYVNGMSKYLATIRHFPEFTSIYGKFGFKTDVKIKVLELMSKKGHEGAYAHLAIKRQLGIDYSQKDILLSKSNEVLGKLTNYSALVGLSSPLAGLKNLIIQIPKSAAVYGTRKTFRAACFAMKSMRDPKLFLEAVKRGETGYGQKELLYGTDKRIRWWFENVNFMTQTENFNRIMTAEAGRLHFAELVNVYRGNKSTFHPQGKPKEVLRMFRETFKLSEKQIDHLKNEVNLYESVQYQDILNYVGFQSHKASAGATGVGDLPLWFSNKYTKPLTLFQRMAGSVTIDSYKNIVKPMKNGNYAPMIKALIGHGVSGAALYMIYDTFLGQQVPTEEQPAIDKAFSFVWRGELLGVFGEILSPYSTEGNLNPLMEPVLIRNFREGGNQLLQAFNYNKDIGTAVNDFMKKTIVIYGHAEKVFNNLNQPYATNHKRIKTLENQWRRKMGVGYKESAGKINSSRTNYYWDLKKSIMFDKSDSDIALAYYKVFDYICDELESGGLESKTEREKEARRAIKSMVKHMNPLDISTETKGRVLSRRSEFLNSLSKSNKELALKLEKEYSYKVRNFEKIIRHSKWREKYSIYPY